MSKPVILTGLRANNDLHIGNYFGALLPIVDMANEKSDEYQINLFVPDLHSFITPIDHDTLQEFIINNVRAYLAAGYPIDKPDIHIYRQSYIPAHSELTWILDCFTGVGEMERMTSYKEKAQQQSKIEGAPVEMFNTPPNFGTAAGYNDTVIRANKQQHKGRVSVGLLNYPVLMASDILLHSASYIPVGDDQTQHLEFTRKIAERMNALFGHIFEVPKAVKDQHKLFGKDQGLRIKDLADPTKKMSKSDETGKGVIYLNDLPEEAKKKILSATTDSYKSINYDPENQPGISNLIEIYCLLNNQSIDSFLKSSWIGSPEYHQLKNVVADRLGDFLKKYQSKLQTISDEQIFRILETGEEAVTPNAVNTLLKVQRAVGLRPRG